MTVTVLLFASYADTLGRDSVELALPEGSTVEDVLARIQREPGGDRLPPRPLVAVNQSYAAAGDRVRSGDEVAIIPPVAGGQVRSAVLDRPLDPARLLAEVSRPANGAAILFVGTVRDVNDGRGVSGIDYAAYRSMARLELERIVGEAAERFQTDDIVVEHRTGTLGLGEASVAIAVAHPHRGPAFDAARYVIEELKRRVPIWKREHYVDGTREWIDPTTVRAAVSP